MNKVFIGIGIIVFIVIAWMLFHTDAADYVAKVDSEVEMLENELMEIEATIQSGALTTKQAVETQKKTIARIDAIERAVKASKKAVLTPQQRLQLREAIDRLKTTLTMYQAALVAVDDSVSTLPEKERPKLRRSGSGQEMGAAVIALEAVVNADVHMNDFTVATDEEIIPLEAPIAQPEVEAIANDNIAPATADSMPATSTEEAVSPVEDVTKNDASIATTSTEDTETITQ